MKPISAPRVFICLFAVVAFSSCLHAQSAGFNVAPAQPVPPNVISFTDTLAGQPDGATTVMFALYPDQQSLNAMWTETQVVQVTQNKYTVLLGSTTPDGIPPGVFAAGQARWLGVQLNGTEKRYLLVSVPYAMKAMEAERLGGLVPSDFVTTQQLQTILLNSTAPGGSGPSKTGTGPTAAGPTGLASTNPPQPATDFVDNNASEVLLVTQQGTGFAIHAVSAGDAALFAENSTATGTALKAVATGTTGANIGILGQSASATGIAGVFDNTGGGQILSLRSNGNEVAGVDNFGNFKASQIQALNFVGAGFGLTNIPNSATTATPLNSNNTIVARDQFGGFSAGQIQALNFAGPGFGLTNVPNTATTATASNVNDTIVVRDQFGGFSAGQIQAFNFVGPGFGLTNIPNSATTATPANSNNTIVARDQFGTFSASQIQALNFVGGGYGLTNIPNSATTATSMNTPNAIVARDQSGSAYIGAVTADLLLVNQQVFTKGSADFSNASSTAPVKVTTIASAPQSCAANTSLLIESDAPAGRQLFICNAAGNGWNLLGDGSTGGVTSVGAADSSIAIGGTTTAPTVEVANGGITSAKLAPNAVTAVNIADGSLSATKIVGTAATLSDNNLFSGSQTIQQNLSVGGALSAGTATINGSLSARTASISGPLTASNPTIAPNATGIHGDGIVGVDAATTFGVGLQARTTGTSQGGIAATFTNSQIGTLISGRIASNAPAGYDENFKVDTYGAVTAASVSAQFANGGSVDLFMPVKLAPNSTQVVPTAAGDKTGAVGIVTDKTSAMVRVAYGGLAECRFDSVPLTIGDYVGISTISDGYCGSLGSQYPNFPGVQVIGRLVSASANFGMVLVFGPERYSAGSVFSIDTGAGLFGGPITGNGFIGIAARGVANSMLQNSSLSINPGAGLSGGGAVSLGGSTTLNIANFGVTNGMLQNSFVQVLPGDGMSVSNGGTLYLGSSVKLTNTGALSFNGRTGNILPAPGDYSFSQLGGTVTANQLPAGVVFNNASNTFTSNQTINGSLSVMDSAPSGGSGFSATSQNNPAAVFTSNGPTILVAGNAVRGVFNLDSAGNLNVSGAVTGASFSGDGSALTNVNASSVGGVSGANLASTSALNTETAARQSADTTLQNNISSEAAARQSVDTTLQNNINAEAATRLATDATLQTSISAETAARQADTSNLQNNINNVSSADAKLTAANTFTASNTFTAGTQDFSAAGATLPVRALPSSQTPASCVASKELLIKTDAAAGQQLFICGASGTTWNLVGDGASGGVTSFNGRNGSVSPSSNDYSFAQISGSVAPGQMPALTGDLNSPSGSTATTLAPSGVSAGTYTKITVDSKGRATSGGQAGFSDLTGTATAAQLPGSVVYNNQVNTFGANQAVNGTLSATLFSGNGGGLNNVNAATLNGIASSGFPLLSANNSFNGSITAAGFSGNGSGLTNVNAATVNSLQLLKLTASLTPSNVNAQTCAEEVFTVSGVNSSDVLLSVQLTTHNPGTNIAIGGWRVSAANTVAIQFCNVSRSNGTPTAGAYTLALMR